MLVVSCDEFRNIWSEGQKQLLPWGEGWETDRRKRHENKRMIEKKVSLHTHLLSYQNWRKQASKEREGLPSLPSMGLWTAALLLLPLHCTSLSKPSPTRAPAALRKPVESQTRLLQGFTKNSHVPPTPPSLGALAETSLLWSTAEGALSRGTCHGQRCCPSSSRVLNNTQPQALSCLIFCEDWLSGEMFLCLCPAKSIFCSFFL